MVLVSGFFHVSKSAVVVENVGISAGAVDAVVDATVGPEVKCHLVSLGDIREALVGGLL